MKKGGGGCEATLNSSGCNKNYTLDSYIEPTRLPVSTTLHGDYSEQYKQPDININTSYSSFGSMAGAGNFKLNKKIIENVLKKLSKKHLKNLKTNIRDTIKQELKSK
tara:strand:+ start:3041 stop:3361 length:321 start_codon:yes stop_codon:yes gene_type:complete